jgi:hypothetical protein
MEQGGAQHYGKFVLVGRAVEDFYISLEVITMEKEAKRHIPCPYLNFYFYYMNRVIT